MNFKRLSEAILASFDAPLTEEQTAADHRTLDNQLIEIVAISYIKKEQMNEVIDTVREALSARLDGRELSDDGGLHGALPRADSPLRRAPAASLPHVLGAGRATRRSRRRG